MGVVGCLRGAGRCVHSDIPIAGAGAGWACAHEARVMLKGKSAGECCQQGFRNILLRWPTIYIVSRGCVTRIVSQLSEITYERVV